MAKVIKVKKSKTGAKPHVRKVTKTKKVKKAGVLSAAEKRKLSRGKNTLSKKDRKHIEKHGSLFFNLNQEGKKKFGGI